MESIGIEGAEVLLDEAVELGHQLRLFVLIVAKDEIHRIDGTGRYLRLECCWSDRRHSR